jgi:hypothetical protein
MTKRLFCAAAAVAAIGVAFAAVPAANASPYVAGCQLTGNATFDNPLMGTTSGPFTYSFGGTLTNCQSSNGGPASGTVFAGQNGLNHATGTGSCLTSTTAGESIVQWADGKTTVIKYTTSGAAAAVALTGSVVAATTEKNATTGVPLYSTTETATPVGSSAGGALAFEANPQDCAGAGVHSAGIAGVIGEGSQN